MPKIRAIQIENFRSLQKFGPWLPSSEVNCLIGSGDSGKTTILDAIDLCLGARRSISFSDCDFHNSDTTAPIKICVVLGGLEDNLLNIDKYGEYVRGLSLAPPKLEDEPQAELEDVLVLRLQVESDLEPSWQLISKRAEAKGLQRNLAWEDRQALSPLRLGEHADWHLSFRRGSMFQRMADEDPNFTTALTEASREARTSFGGSATAQLADTLDNINQTATGLGVGTGGSVTALLDANAVSFGSGAISLHNQAKVPLSALGTGSKRLLISGMASKATRSNSITLVDEVETGLEPHRIRSFLNTLGAKDAAQRQQVFATTHSPVVLRELRYDQLAILRRDPQNGQHNLIETNDAAQGILRSTPEAFLAKSVLICEGKSEIGYVRGFDQYHCENQPVYNSIEALGVVPVDAGGANKIIGPAKEFLRLGYRVAIFMDSDVPLDANDEAAFINDGGAVFKWPNSWALEDAVFQNAQYPVLSRLIEYAVELHGEPKIDSHIQTATSNTFNLATVRRGVSDNTFPAQASQQLGQAAKFKNNSWFKRIEPYEHIAKTILAPNWSSLHQPIKDLSDRLMQWCWS